MPAAPGPASVVLGLQIGPAEEQFTRGRKPFRTGIRKRPVAGPCWLGRTGFDGDEQGDLVNHGGEHKAVLAYAADHYPGWQAVLSATPLPPASFGENLTVGGLAESSVCIGDQFRVGSALVEVSQPRQPCWKLNHRWHRDDLVELVERSGRTGWYFRVVSEGQVAVGDLLSLERRPHPGWPVSLANAVMRDRSDRVAAARLAALPELAPRWRASLQRPADGVATDLRGRRLGPDDEEV